MSLLPKQALHLESTSHILALCFLASVLFMPYQTRWSSITPQTGLLLLGSALSLVAVFMRQRWREVRLDWPLLLFMGALTGSVVYHQAFNIYARAYVLSFAAYLWLRHALKLQDLLLLVWVGMLFLLSNMVLMIMQLWGCEAFFVARYFTHLDSFRVPLGFFDIPTTVSLTPAIVVLFLLSMQARQYVKPSLMLNLCYFSTPFSILAPVSRSSIASFLVAFAMVLMICRREWRHIWRPALLLGAGFLVFAVLIFKSQEHLDIGNVLEYKIARPVKSIMANEASAPVVDSSAMSRVLMWKVFVVDMASHPELLWQGIGIGQSEVAFKRQLESGKLDRNVFGDNIISPHNSFVEVFYEGGLFVGVAFLLFLASRIFGYGNWSSPWFGSLLFLTVFMVFWDLLRMRYFWIVLALVEVYRHLPRNEANTIADKKERL